MPRKQAKREDTVPLAIFRPDSRDGGKDYMIPADVAKRLYQEGKIWGDATNGGYMPAKGVRYDVAQHKVRAAEWHDSRR